MIDFIKFAKELSLFISLNTNGINLTEYDLETLMDQVDMFHLPVDAATPAIQKVIRGVSSISIQNIKKVKHLNEIRYKGIIKIATVATSKNYDDIFLLPVFFDKHNVKFNIWRIYQFRAHGRGAKNAKTFELSNSLFTGLLENLRKN